jgi:enoyl-CoA hydratase/3-hydroxyacyl-CoA dehydrogenase
VTAVAVIGAGTMGAGISALFSNADFDVILVDKSEEALKRARDLHEGEYFEQLEKAGLKRRNEIVSKISYTTHLGEIGDSSFVVEAIVEDLEEKVKLLRRVENFIDENCVIGTNTSTFKPSEIAKHLYVPERLVLFHFSTPPVIRELIEVAGELASEDAILKAVEMGKKIGKKPVVLKKECRGHVLNRILAAGGAALSFMLLDARPEQIDISLRNLGADMGIFEAYDYIGIDVVLHVTKALREEYGDRYLGSVSSDFFIEKMVKWGKLGKKTGEGFYEWENGQAKIPGLNSGASDTQPADVMPFIAAMVNEAFKIVEEGIADEDAVNKIYQLATGGQAGILDLAEMIGLPPIRKILKEYYSRFRREIFKPAKSLES